MDSSTATLIDMMNSVIDVLIDILEGNRLARYELRALLEEIDKSLQAIANEVGDLA